MGIFEELYNTVYKVMIYLNYYQKWNINIEY